MKIIFTPCFADLMETVKFVFTLTGLLLGFAWVETGKIGGERDSEGEGKSHKIAH